MSHGWPPGGECEGTRVQHVWAGVRVSVPRHTSYFLLVVSESPLPRGFPRVHIPHCLLSSTGRSPDPLQAWSVGLPSLGHQCPQLSHLLVGHWACCPSLRNSPETHLLLSVAPSPVEALTREVLASFSLFLFQFFLGPEARTFFPEDDFVHVTTPAQKSPITA